jgi:sulfide dehydrogenase cytochrome subunit
MNKRICSNVTFLFVLASFAFSSAAIGDVTSPAKDCDVCHGQDGISEWPDVPSIAGMSAYTQSDTLYIFQERGRPCISSEYRLGDTSREPTDMCAVVDKLTEDEIEELAAYYSAKPFVAAKQEFDPSKTEIGRKIHAQSCEKCHTDGGSNPEEDAGILAGQWTDYLRQSFDAYLSGDRDQPKKMKEKMASISEEDIDALVHYYASQQ